jgi:hypothetical protein
MYDELAGKDFALKTEPLSVEGYYPGVSRPAPDNVEGWGIGYAIDMGMCARATCYGCGHQGMEHRTFVASETSRSHRGFAVCPMSDHWEEF